MSSTLRTALVIDKQTRKNLGDDFLKSLFETSKVEIVVEFSQDIFTDIREAEIKALLYIGAPQPERRFKKDLESAGVNPLAVDMLDQRMLGDKEYNRALILAYLAKLGESDIVTNVKPVRAKGVSRRDLIRGSLSEYVPIPILDMEARAEREVNTSISACPKNLLKKGPDGPELVDPDQCSACGYCSGSSYLGYLEVPTLSTRAIVAFLNTLSENAPDRKASVVFTEDITNLPRFEGVDTYPLGVPCVASIHDSFLALTTASGFLPVIYYDPSRCSTQEMAKKRIDEMMKKFPGTNIGFPVLTTAEKIPANLQFPKWRSKIPTDILVNRNKRRSLLLWAIQEVGKKTSLDKEDEVPGVFFPSVDPYKCTACGSCVKACQMLVFDLKVEGEKVEHYSTPGFCIGSERCIKRCPENCIIVNRKAKLKELGKTLLNEARVMKCRYCGTPIGNIVMKSRVDGMLVEKGFTGTIQYTDVCNNCKHKVLAREWVKGYINLGKDKASGL